MSRIHRNTSRVSSYFKNSCRVCTWRYRSWGWSMRRFIMLRLGTRGSMASCWIIYLWGIRIEWGIYSRRTHLFWINRIKNRGRSWVKLWRKCRYRLSLRRSSDKKDRFWPSRKLYTVGEHTKNKWRRSSRKSNRNRLK